MLKNYFMTAIRNLVRHKLYSFINIGGLTIGLAACLMIFLFVQNELSYDKQMPAGERIVRMETLYDKPDQVNVPIALSPGPVSKPMAAAFPGAIEASTRMLQEGFLVRQEEIRFSENFWLVDDTFFDVFDLEIVAGDRAATFNDYKSVVLTETMAKKFFGDKPAVGEVLDLDSSDMLVKVVAVMKDLPENSHLNINFLMHFDESRYVARPWVNQWWVSSNVFTYIKLTSAAAASTLLAGMPNWYNENAIPGPAISADQKPGDMVSFSFMPLRDIHLYSLGRFQMKTAGDIMVVYSFTAIAVLILIIAIINFTNLSTARASLRAREIALRKVVGASRKQLIGQFLGEALLTTTIALIFAFAIVEIALPSFREFVEKALSFNQFGDPVVQIGLVAVIAVIGLSAGAYPSLTLSAYRPARVLHSNNAATSGSVKLRAGLTMLQFTISIGLMITTAVVYSQLRYAQEIESGFDKEDRVLLNNMTFGPVREVATTLRQEIEALPGVQATSFNGRSLPLRGFWDFPVKGTKLDPNLNLKLENIPVDFTTLQFYNAELVAGRFFDPDRRGDLPADAATEGANNTETAIVNETAISFLGYPSPESILGDVIQVLQADGSYTDAVIVGVVKDMHLRSLRDVMGAHMFALREGPLQILNIHVDPLQAQATQLQIEEIWNRLAPEMPINARYLSDSFEVFYAPDRQRAQMFAGFSIFAMLVSCLGLYGLASFTAERRIKEIGVRKIMGARVRDIVAMLTFQFSKPVLLANLVAWPIAWYVADTWLSGFVYRIDLSILYFVAAGAVALTIACLTVAGHAFKTARANPIAALKYE